MCNRHFSSWGPGMRVHVTICDLVLPTSPPYFLKLPNLGSSPRTAFSPSPDTGGSPGASCSWTCPTRYPSFISPPLGSIVFLGTVSPRPTVMPWTWDSVPAARYSLWQGRKRFSPVNSRARLRWGSMLYFQALCFQALCFTGFAEAGLALRPPLL